MHGSDPLNFQGMNVLVTGASDGIGYGIAKAFRDCGAEVSVTGTQEQQAYNRDFSKFRYLKMDCSDADSVERLAGLPGPLDILINSVGTVLYKGQEFERSGFARVVDINLTGIMHLCTVFRDKLAETRGCIINLDSCAARVAARNNPAYSASKAGLVQLTAALALKWGKLGIRVNGIGPGMVPTKLTANQSSETAEERFRSIVPAGRLGSPEDMAGVALFLASPLAAYVTGQSIVVDGGLTLVGAL